jgi:hypothetical protein
MNATEKYLLSQYKANKILKVTRFAEGAYQIETGGRFFMAENSKTGALFTNEWIVREGKFNDYDVIDDNYVGHWDTLQEAEFDLVQMV